MIERVWPPKPAKIGGAGLSTTWREPIASIALTSLVFAAILAFGSDRNDFALLFSALFGLLLFILLVSEAWARDVILTRARLLFVPAALYLISILAVAWSATPYGPNGPHPIWTYVQTLPAIAIDRSAIFVGIAKLSGLACAFVLGWLICSSDSRAKYFLRCFVVAVSLYGAWALLANLNPALKMGLYNAFQAGRLSGSFQSANTAGTLFGMGFVLAISLVFDDSHHADVSRGALLAKITIPLIAAMLLGTCLVLTVSRGAVTATLASCVLLSIWEMFARDWHGIQKRNLTYGLAFAIGLLVLAWSGGLLVDRYASSVKDWIDQRETIYSVHWGAFLVSPWFGYGLGTFDEINKLLQDATNYPALWNMRATHNVYLQWLEEGGIVGTTPMFACLAWIILSTALGTRNRRHMTTWLRGLVAVSLVVLIHGWSDYSLEVPAIAMMWSVLLGSGYAMSTSPRAKQAPPYAQLPQNSDKSFELRRVYPIVTIATFAAVMATLCATAWWEIDTTIGQAHPFLPISNVYAYRAEQLLKSGEDSSDNNAKNIQAAQLLTQQELTLSPARADGWLRLAVIASITRRPSADTSQLLDKSYLVAPLDPQIFLQRTRFVLEHWDSVTSSVRQEALEQIHVGWDNWIEKNEIIRLAKIVRNPAGRFALNFEVAQLSSQSGLVGKDN